MTPDELRERVAEFMENNDLHDDGEHTCGYSHDLLGHNLESLCREMIAAGLERAAVEVSFHAYAKDHAIWCRQESQRVKAT